MTTTSRPVIYDAVAVGAGTISATDTNVTGDDWQRFWLHDAGVDSGMGLTLSAVSDVGTIGTGVGVWRGFALSVTVAHDVNLPAVTSPKTYSIGVKLDPAGYSTPDGPLSIAVFDKTAIVVPSGGWFWTLWEVDRIPAATLASSTVRTYRHVRGNPTIYCTTLPLAAEYALGMVAVTNSGTYVRTVAGSTPAWSLVNGDTAWVNVTPAAGAIAAAFGPMTTRLTDNQTTRQFRGSVKRSDGGVWTAGVAVRIGSVGSGSPPAFARTWSVAGPSVSVLFELTTTGDINMTPSGTLSSVRIDGSVPL